MLKSRPYDKGFNRVLRKHLMNKILRVAIMFIAFSLMIACGSGFVTSNPGPTQTYTFTGFVGPNVIQTNCNTSTAPFYTCNKSSSNFSFSIAFISSNPPTYLQLPSPLPVGVTMTSTPGCANISGSNYSCQIDLSGTNVESGSIVNVPYNGSYGYQGGFTITYQ